MPNAGTQAPKNWSNDCIKEITPKGDISRGDLSSLATRGSERSIRTGTLAFSTLMAT